MHDLHFAVVVGINRYPGLGDLRYARNDADAFRQWLVDPDGGQLDEANVHLVAADDEDFPDVHDAHPKWHDVNVALRRVNSALRTKLDEDPVRWEDTRLYVFVSGHGITPDGGKAALLMADADVGAMGNNIELSRYADWYEKCALFREVVLLADCCRDRRDTAPGLGPPFDRCTVPADPVNVMIGYAAAMGDQAFEPEQDGDPDAGRGYFTKALLDGLRGEAADPATGAVDAVSLSRYVRQAVQTLTADRPRPQDARIEATPGDPIVFRPPTATPAPRLERAVTIRFPGGFTGPVELRDGALEVRATWEANGGPWAVHLPDGFYGVRPAGAEDGSLFTRDGLFAVAGGDRDVQL